MAVRKRATKMTSTDKKRFRDVISALIANGSYGRVVRDHAGMSHKMHHHMGAVGLQRFLPLHRVFLLRLEQAMQAIDPLSFIPYWRWTSQRSVPPWLSEFLPTVTVSGRGAITVSRNVGVPPPLPRSTDIADVMDEDTFTDFAIALAIQHDNVHGWVGGTMAILTTAPADVLFWLHHAQVDRLWSVWQAAHPGLNPTLSGSDGTMDPWAETEQQVRSIGGLGYSYGP